MPPSPDSRDATPILSDVGWIALVPEPWSDQWQVRHQVLTRLARYFHVVWVDPPHGWRETGRALRKRPAAVPLTNGFSVYIPDPWLPHLYRPATASRWLFHARLKRARAMLERRGVRRVLLHLWRPEFAAALEARRIERSIYEIDDEYSFSPVATPIDPAERDLIRRVDQVFIHSAGLLERKGSINPHTDYMPNGVDYEAFARPSPEPADLAPIPRPRIGYAGMIKKHLDWPLLRDLAARHTDWSFVFVGSRAGHRELPEILAPISRLPNVHFLKGRSSVELAAVPQHFDVGIMPYVEDDFSRFGYPLKLHEYLASGRPAVGIPMRTLQDFAHVVGLARSLDEWSDALRAALAPEANTPAARARRQTVARAHDWSALVQRMAGIVARRLGEADYERLREALRARGEELVPPEERYPGDLKTAAPSDSRRHSAD